MNPVEFESKPTCPVCGLRSVMRIHADCIECPDHGFITGLRFVELKGKSRVHALIDIRCDQAMEEVRRMVVWAHQRIEKVFA